MGGTGSKESFFIVTFCCLGLTVFVTEPSQRKVLSAMGFVLP
jgi:hypothetical protein